MDEMRILGYEDMERRKNGDDGGLFTGETVLHICIANKDVRLVRFLLKWGADVNCKATGAFFMPRIIRRKRKTGNTFFDNRYWDQLLAIVQNRDLRKFPRFEVAFNEHSAFSEHYLYWGEYPVSFAATVGNTEILRLLIEHSKTQAEQMVEARSAGDLPLWARQGWEHFTKADQKCEWTTMMLRLNAITQVDSFGNTALHLAALHQRTEVFDYLQEVYKKLKKNLLDPFKRVLEDLENKYTGYMDFNDKMPSLSDPFETLNNEGLTPFTLTARLGLSAMYRHILKEHMETIDWTFGDMKMSHTSLTQIDTFRMTNKYFHAMSSSVPNSDMWRSAVEVITEHEVEDLWSYDCDPLYERLLLKKWDAFARRMYIWRRLIPYMLYVGLFGFSVWFRSSEVNQEWEQAKVTPNTDLSAKPGAYYTGEWTISAILSQALGIATIVLFFLGIRSRRLGPFDLDPDQVASGETDIKSTSGRKRTLLHKNLNFLNLTAISVLVFPACTLQLIGIQTETELALLSVACLLVFAQLLQMMTPFKAFGEWVLLMYQILVSEVLLASFIYFVVLCAVSMAMFVTFQLADDPSGLRGTGGLRLDSGPDISMITLFYISLSDTWHSDTAVLGAHNTSLCVTLLIIWVVMSAVLIMNLIISIMKTAFDQGQQNKKKIWIFPFAVLVLHYESQLSESDKTKYRTGTADEMESGFVKDGEKLSHQTFHEKNLTQFTELRKGSRIKLDPPQKHENRGVSRARKQCADVRTQCINTVTALTKICEDANKEANGKIASHAGLGDFRKQSVTNAVNKFNDETLSEVKKFVNESIGGLDAEAQKMEIDMEKELMIIKELSDAAAKWREEQEDLRNRPATEVSFQKARQRILRIEKHERDRAKGVEAKIQLSHIGLSV